MIEKLQAVLSKPFLLIQIGDYGHEYETMPIPPGLLPMALERQQFGKMTYPTSLVLPPPHLYVPADVQGILMNKSDVSINGFAYWAQKLDTRVHKRCCINSSPVELLRFSNMVNPFWAVLVKKETTTAPKGNTPGRVFERWTPAGYVCEPPTDQINTDVVYTEAGKTTLIFQSLEVLREHVPIDLNQYHVFFTPVGGLPHDTHYGGKRLPYRSSMYGTCSLLMQGRPDEETGIPLLRPENASRSVVALASIHQHICGRVLA
jgi:hypothetical protein